MSTVKDPQIQSRLERTKQYTSAQVFEKVKSQMANVKFIHLK